MNFRPRIKSKPELNLIPMIDVLIVLLIFLVLTTTFSHETALQIQLPEANEQVNDKDDGIELAIDANGHYSVNGHEAFSGDVAVIKRALVEAAGQNKAPLVTISADKSTKHQSVISALDAASQLGFVHVTFAVQSSVK